MIELLTVAVLCLSASTAALAASVPFLFYKCFRFEARLKEEIARQDKCIETLDETLARLLDGLRVPEEKPR